MKKIVLTGLAIFLALSLSTCDMPPLGSNTGDTGEEFAQYSADGKSITINLEGGAPSRNMDRALTNALAQINHDYYEVVFYYDDDTTAGAAHTAPNIARTSWVRGEGAALSVYRGGASGIDYGSVDYAASIKSPTPATVPDTGAALLLVGKKESGRYVLLAVGKLISTTKNDGTPGSGAVVTTQTSKVTFEIVTLASAIFPDRANLATKSSFYTIPDTTDGSYNFASGAAAINAASTADNPGQGTNFVEQIFNDVKFPLFMLNSVKNETTPTTSYYAAKFTFTTASAGGPAISGHLITDYVKGIVAATPAGHQYVDDKVPPAVIINGEKQPKITTDSSGVTVEMKNNNDPTPSTGDVGKPINPEAYFIITVPGNQGGMMAFNFNIPVYGITSQISNNGGIQPVLWLIQPGLERFYVDNGVGLGGSILLGLGDPTKVDVNTGFRP